MRTASGSSITSPFDMMCKQLQKILLTAVVLLALAAPLRAETRLRMSTTTSTDNSGLLAVLLPPFEKQHDVKVDVIAVGTGKALKLGENGDVDLVFVHARRAEEEFVARGHGIYRKDVMHNDFVLVGPHEDPAGIGRAGSAAEAFRRLAEQKADFISRGDDSGTHKKEKKIWRSAGITPEGAWYIEAGQGMGVVLQIADEKRGYALSDRGTFIAYQGKIDLAVVYEGDPVLHNPYGIIAVNPARYAHVKHDLAKKLVDYITGPEGQGIVAGFRLNGRQLFYPDAIAIP